MIFSSKKQEIWLIAIGAAYCIYLIFRAFLIPATIDEAYSVLYYVPLKTWDILTYNYPSPSANNHILNTFSIKFWGLFFGQNLLSARLANLMAGALYAGCGIWLVRQLFEHPMAKIAGLVLWLENHYLAEFFSIGRGYGMSIGFMALSICGFYSFVKSLKTNHLALTMVAAWLAVASNFTLLNYYCCLSAILFVILLTTSEQRRGGSEPPRRLMGKWRQMALFFTSHLLLATLMYLPVTRMLAANEFVKFGVSGFFEDTVQGFVRSFFLGQQFLANGMFKVAELLLVAYFLAACLLLLAQWLLTRKWTLRLLLAALFPGTVIVNIAITLLTDAAWLPARTCVFFYPLLAVSLFMNGLWLVEHNRQRFRTPLLAMSLASAIFFTRAVNLRQSHEWWFDRDSFTVLDYLENMYETEHRTKPISFNSHWLFSNSLKFHLTSNWGNYAQYIQPDMNWRETPEPQDNYEFFYTEMKDYPKLAEDYQIVLELEKNSRVLLRKRTNPVK